MCSSDLVNRFGPCIDQFVAYGFVLRPMWNQTPSIAVQFISLAGFNDGGHDLGWGNVETLLDFDG